MTDPGEQVTDVREWPGLDKIEDRVPGYLNGAAFLTVVNQVSEKTAPEPVMAAYPAAMYSDPTIQHSHQIEPNVREVVIYCGAGFSDYLFALPALDAIRLAYPQAVIVLLGGARLQAFLQDRPGPVDRVETDYRSLTGKHFDLALLLGRPGSEAEPVDLLRWIRARVAVGFQSGLDRSLPFVYDQHNLMRNLEIASLLGAETHELEPAIVLSEQDRIDSFTLIPETDRALIVLAPGGAEPRRSWPVEKFAAVGRALVWAGAQVVVSGRKGDPMVEALIDLLPAVTYLDEEAPVGALGWVFRRASVTIANPGELLYLAQAAGSRTVGIYWCADLMTSGPLTRGRHRPAISWQLNCPECGLNLTRTSCGHQASLVTSISQEEVLTSVLELSGLQPLPLLRSFSREAASSEQAVPVERKASGFQAAPDRLNVSGQAA